MYDFKLIVYGFLMTYYLHLYFFVLETETYKIIQVLIFEIISVKFKYMKSYKKNYG